MTALSPFRPLARFDDLVMNQLAQELLVFDQRNQQIHHLDAVSAAIWRHCDGERTVPDLARLVSRDLGEPVALESVDLALRQLSEVGLLVEAMLPTGPRESRRSLLRKAAVGGALVAPAIVSISAPQAALAQSTCPGEVCDTDGVCCTGGMCDGNGNCCGLGWQICPNDGVCCLGGFCTDGFCMFPG